MLEKIEEYKNLLTQFAYLIVGLLVLIVLTTGLNLSKKN